MLTKTPLLLIVTGCNEVVAKIIFLNLSVILFTGGGSTSVHAGRPPCQGDPPAREIPLPRRPPCQGDPRSRHHPRRKLKGIRSRPTPKGEIEGDQIQAHTQGGNWGGQIQAAPPRSRLRHTVNERPVRILLECILVLVAYTCCLNNVTLKTIYNRNLIYIRITFPLLLNNEVNNQ